VRPVHWLVSIPATVVLIDFAIANQQEVPVVLWPVLDTLLPEWIVVLIGLAGGVLIGAALAWIAGRHVRREGRAKARRIAALEHELRAVEARLEEARGATAPASAALPPAGAARH